MLRKEKYGHQVTHKTLYLQSALPAKCAGSMVVPNVWEWPTSVWFNLLLPPHPEEMEPLSYTTWMTGGRIKHNWPKKKKFWYTQRTVPCLIVIGQTSCGLRWEKIQRSTDRHAERESKLDVSIRPLPMEIRDPEKEKEGITVGLRGDGWHRKNTALSIN